MDLIFITALVAFPLWTATAGTSTYMGQDRPDPCFPISNSSQSCGDMLTLLQVAADVRKRATAPAIFDLHGNSVFEDAVYHAVIKLEIGREAVFVDMAPKAKVVMASSAEGKELEMSWKMASGRDQDIRQYEMFFVDHRRSFMASCDKDHVFFLPDMSIRSDFTLGELASYWKGVHQRKDHEWGPAGYNCQSFALEVLDVMASHMSRAPMRTAVQTLMHDDKLVTDAFTNTKFAAWIANKVKGSPKDPLYEINDNPAFQSIVNQPIDSAHLFYYTAGGTGSTFGTTSKQSRSADFKQRQERLCAYETQQAAGGGGQTMDRIMYRHVLKNG